MDDGHLLEDALAGVRRVTEDSQLAFPILMLVILFASLLVVGAGAYLFANTKSLRTKALGGAVIFLVTAPAIGICIMLSWLIFSAN